MTKIKNPILSGFKPDPSILRVDDDYYIATSTFEWFPGVAIYHSRDLVHWHLLTKVLSQTTQIDMTGEEASCGVWAPCLSYSNGTFYLVYTDLRNDRGNFIDAKNYLITAKSITGPWTERIFLNSSGFDPSLFHDEDGKKWLVSMQWDFRKKSNKSGGILLQEYSEKEKKLIGSAIKIFSGTSIGLTEGPHLYKYNSYYYLLVAEGGGAGFGHAACMARAKTITGPYEEDTENPILTAKNNPENPLQKAGHASLVQTQNNKWYLAYLCSRPLKNNKRCILGRETALHEVYWNEQGWLRLKHGNIPQEIIDSPNLALMPFDPIPACDNFDSEFLGIQYFVLRNPDNYRWLSLTERKGFLRIYGQDSPTSRFNQSIVARPLEDFKAQITTCVEFMPDHFNQMAGLICYYNNSNFYYLHITHDEALGRCLKIIEENNATYNEPTFGNEIAIQNTIEKIYLRVCFNYDELQFYYSTNGKEYFNIGNILDASILSDDYCNGYTGAMVGLCVNDMSSSNKFADFDFFEYIALSN